MTVSPSLQFKDKNATLQMYGTAPGSEVYPKDANLCPYFNTTDDKLVYVNHLPTLSVGDALTIKINGKIVGTSYIRNSDGLYIYEFNPPYGYFQLATVLPDTTEITQDFTSKNLLLFSAVEGQEYESYRDQALDIIGGANAKNYDDGGIFLRICTDAQLSTNYASHLGFDRPVDWTYLTYVGAIAGDIENGIQGTTGSLAATPTVVGSSFSGLAITNLLPTELFWYRGRSTTAVSGGFAGNVADIDTYPSRYPSIVTWGTSSDATLYLLFKNSVAASLTGLYSVGIDSNNKLVAAMKPTLDNKLRTSIANFCPLYDVFVAPSGFAFVIADHRVITTKVQKQGVFSAKKDGASVDSVKDVIESVTDYRPTTTDMRHLQLDYRLRATGIRHGVATPLTVEDVAAGHTLTPIAGYAAQYLVNPATGSTTATHGVYAWGREVGFDTSIPKLYAEYGGAWDAAGLAAAASAFPPDTCFSYGVPTAANPTYIAMVVKLPSADFNILAGINYDGKMEVWPEATRDANGYLPIAEFAVDSALQKLTLSESMTPCPYDNLARLVNVKTNAGWVAGKDLDPTNDTLNGGYPQSLAIDDTTHTIPASLITLGYTPSQFNAGAHYTNNHVIDIIHDGFTIADDVIVKTAVNGVDQLSYSWINPFADPPAYLHNIFQEQFIGLSTFTLAVYPVANSTELYVNGIYQKENIDYTVSTTGVVAISTSIDASDVIDVVCAGSTPVYTKESFTANPATLSTSVISDHHIKVWLNGTRLFLEAGDYTITGATLTLNVAFSAGDTIDVMYIGASPAPCFYSVSLDRSALPDSGEVHTSFPFDYMSAMLYINGVAQPKTEIIESPNTGSVLVSASIMANTFSGDILTVATNRQLAYNVAVRQVLTNGTTVNYYQGLDFLVNYTTGKIEWITGRPQPDTGTSYYASYAYFPEDILTKLLRTVRPATGIISQRYIATDGQEFNPYDRFAWPFKDPQDDLVM